MKKITSSGTSGIHVLFIKIISSPPKSRENIPLKSLPPMLMTLFYFLMTTVFSVKPVVRTRESGTSMIYSGSGSHPVSKFFLFFILIINQKETPTSAISISHNTANQNP